MKSSNFNAINVSVCSVKMSDLPLSLFVFSRLLCGSSTLVRAENKHSTEANAYLAVTATFIQLGQNWRIVGMIVYHKSADLTHQIFLEVQDLIDVLSTKYACRCDIQPRNRFYLIIPQPISV